MRSPKPEKLGIQTANLKVNLVTINYKFVRPELYYLLAYIVAKIRSAVVLQIYSECVNVPLDLLFEVVKCLSIIDVETNCQLLPDPGPCEVFEPSWFFNKTSGVCAVFTYGGCKGNANRFTSYDECQADCHGT